MVLDLEEFKKSSKLDVNQWLNKVLTSDETVDLKELVDQLSTEVEDAIRTCNANIADTTNKMIHDLPKIARELEISQYEIQRLEKDVKMGLSEAETVQKKTTSSMTTLEKLDSMKSKVVGTSQALQEADKWTSLAKQIEQLLDSGDVNKSYECILGMEKSLSVLNKAQAEERRLILEEMKNRLEALATKHLVLAFDTNNTESAKYFFTMFVNLDRVQQYIKYLQTSEKLKLSQEWRKYIETLAFKDAAVKFYDSIIDHLRSKVAWCKIIFADVTDVHALNVLVDLYTDTLRSLEPSPLFCFESETKKQPFIDILIHYNQSTDRFVQNVKQFMELQGTTVDATKVANLLKTCFSPFLSQYDKYAKYHEIQIYNKVQAATAATIAATSSNETTSILQERIDGSKRLLPEIILHIKEGEEKVKIFNRGFGYLHFGKGLSSGLERFINWNQDIFRFMEKSLEGHESQPRNALENVLAYTENCGEILRQLVKLDQTLSTNCARVFGIMKSTAGSPWEDLWGYYLNSQLRVEILQFVQKKETLLGRAVTQMKKLCRDSTQLVLRVTAEPIQGQLGRSFQVGDSSLKEAIPSEYITQMGEYLMLLPQNLEPFIVSENSAISFAFDQNSDEIGRSPVDFILTSLAGIICNLYTDRIMQILTLTDGQAKQLAQDIDYLASVLEDLGLKLTSDLLEISKLLKNYTNLNEMVEKCSPRIFNAVKKMRMPGTQ
ncbi:unnamed protein product [Allacma fusca]|uniref:Conserved oligomeric Golgi complex subunit 7 n=1 Tax=Allacma fusca TaxID=39272 RepID=A0A8J2KRA2_9HEXA|nr:unnamed protein product [Allacma fusca]